MRRLLDSLRNTISRSDTNEDLTHSVSDDDENMDLDYVSSSYIEDDYSDSEIQFTVKNNDSCLPSIDLSNTKESNNKHPNLSSVEFRKIRKIDNQKNFPFKVDDYIKNDLRHKSKLPKIEKIINKIDTNKEYKNTDFSNIIRNDTCPHYLKTCKSLPILLQERQLGHKVFNQVVCSHLLSERIPFYMNKIVSYRHKVFCGICSSDENSLLVASQDQSLQLFKVDKNSFQPVLKIQARDVGWSIVDVDFNRDGSKIIYSSWSDFVHLYNLETDNHVALPMRPNTADHFCLFSLKFSNTNDEILGGSNSGYVYIYDLKADKRTLAIRSHNDDIGGVAFADDSCQILYTGADDGFIKVWDRRTLKDGNTNPVGIFAGHCDGITFIDSKNDGRHLISNCKDQTIKLWDIRAISPISVMNEASKHVSTSSWDYRWKDIPKRYKNGPFKTLKWDTSLMTYRGHEVKSTLMRCRFSPATTTGQKFIYCGSADGAIFVYDVLTGNIVRYLHGHKSIVRDVYWHANLNSIISSSWDQTVAQWTYKSLDAFDIRESNTLKRKKCDDCYIIEPHFKTERPLLIH